MIARGERGAAVRTTSRSVLSVALALGVFLTGCAPRSESSGRDAAARREVRVAAASDLQFALAELVPLFERAQPGIEVKVTYGSSGNFFNQLSNRAPFDLFLSADLEYPRRLATAGSAASSTLFRYAVGRVVVWVPNDSPIEVERLQIHALTEARKIAIANPEHAPYGRAAVEAMKHFGLYDTVRDRLVLGENIAQTAQFVASGGAEIGIIALSLAIAPEMRAAGRYWEIPLEAYPRLEQGGVVLSWAQDQAAAIALRDFMVAPAGRAVLERYGFIPGEK